MIPPRLLTFALFSSALVAAVWWKRHSQPKVTIVKAGQRQAEVPWIDVT